MTRESLSNVWRGLDVSLLLDEAQVLVSLAWPVMLTFLLETSIEILTILFAGRLGTLELSAAVMGYMFCNLTGFSVGIGMATAMDKLAPQAYGQSLHTIPKRKEATPSALDIVFQRSLLISLLVSFPIMAVWWHSPALFSFLGQSDAVSHATGNFIRAMIPSVLPALVFENIKKWRQAQKDAKSSLLTMLTGIVINVSANYLLTWEKEDGPDSRLGWGYLGAPIATCITYCSLPFVMVFFISLIDYQTSYYEQKKTDTPATPFLSWFQWRTFRQWWRKEAFTDWASYLGLGIPGAITLSSESGAFELCCFLAGLLGEHTLNQNAYLQSMVHLLFMLPFGLSVATTNRVGRLLGSSAGAQARMCSIASLLVSAVLTTVASGIILFLVYPLVSLSNQNEFADILFVSEIPDFERTLPPDRAWQDIQHEKILLILALTYFIFDGIQSVASGALKGCGQHRIVALGYVAAYFLVGFPIGFHFAFRDGFGLIGLWCGMMLGGLFLMIFQTYMVFQLSFKSDSK